MSWLSSAWKKVKHVAQQGEHVAAAGVKFAAPFALKAIPVFGTGAALAYGLTQRQKKARSRTRAMPAANRRRIRNRPLRSAPNSNRFFP